MIVIVILVSVFATECAILYKEKGLVYPESSYQLLENEAKNILFTGNLQTGYVTNVKKVSQTPERYKIILNHENAFVFMYNYGDSVENVKVVREAYMQNEFVAKQLHYSFIDSVKISVVLFGVYLIIVFVFFVLSKFVYWISNLKKAKRGEKQNVG